MEEKDEKNKNEGHRRRLRDRFLEYGADGLTDSDMLELLLTLGTPRIDCKDTARNLLASCGGSFSRTLDCSRAELEQIKGIGPKNAFAIHFVQAVARRYLRERMKGKRYIQSSNDVCDYLVHTMRSLGREKVVALFLDSSHAIIAVADVAEGSLASAAVHPRELVKLALKHNAAAVIVAHNHPSGSLRPSPQDCNLTKSLYLALKVCEIQLLDHFIVGAESKPYSFADNGIMHEIRDSCETMLGKLNRG